MMDDKKIDLSIFLSEYVNDARDGFQKANTALLLLEKDRSRIEQLDVIARAFHTLKSSSTMIGFPDIGELAHSAEDIIGVMKTDASYITQEAIDIIFKTIDLLEAMVKEYGEKKGRAVTDRRREIDWIKERISLIQKGMKVTGEIKQSSAGRKLMPSIERIDFVRVNMKLLDSMFNLVGEMIITKNRIDTLLSGSTDKGLKATLSSIGRMVTAMQENVSAARLVQVDEIFQKFPRMVRDLAMDKDKRIDLILEGKEIELDKSVLDSITEPLIHLLRNAVDHGIELPEERERQKKNREGSIKLTARRSENHILIDVEDDGRGLDFKSIKETAVRKGFLKAEEAEAMQDKDVINLLFSSGFSSAEEVTELSGRGIGLNVVKTAAREMGGTVEVATEIGKGTKFSLTLPLTTAVMQTLMVEEGGYVFAIPSEMVLETQRIAPSDIKEIGNEDVIVHEDRVIPFIRLGNALDIARDRKKAKPIAVIIQRGNRFISIGVDEVLGQIENIIKPFDPIAQKFKGFSGGIIMGDGRVALMIDIPTLFNFETLHEESFTV